MGHTLAKSLTRSGRRWRIHKRPRVLSLTFLIAAVILTVDFAPADCPDTDLNSDCFVDIVDLSIFANQWLAPPAQPADFDIDGYVNMDDFTIIARQWHTEGVPLAISDVMASNGQIEIYNYGDEDIDTAGMHLTDNFSIPTKWQFPFEKPELTTVASGGYLLVWADNDVNAQGLHADFQLDAEAGQVDLYDSTGTVLIDSVEFGFQAVEIFTDEEQFVISDRVMSLHMIYHTMPDSAFTNLLQVENMTIAQWAAKAGVGSMRYQGGTTVKYWDWQNPSYTYTSDPWNPNYSGPAKPDSEAMGLDDYLRFVQESGIQPHIGINNFSGIKYNRFQDSIDRAAAQIQYIVDAGYTGAVYYIGNEEDHRQGGPDGAAYIDMLHAQAIKAIDPTCKIIWNNNGANGQNVRRMLEQCHGWLDGVERHGKIGGNFKKWQTTTPMPESNGGQSLYRTRANKIREAATRQGYPNIFIANNEYGGGKSDDIYRTGMIRTEQLLEMFIGNYDMSAYWNITAMLKNSNSRLQPIHFSWEMLGNAHSATMLNIATTATHVPGFAVKTDDDIQLFQLNKSSSSKPLNVDFSGWFTVKTDGSHSGTSLVDTNDHWGELQPLDLTYSNGTFSGTLPPVSFSRMVFPLTSPADTTPPAAPTGLTAIHIGGNMVLDWWDNAEGDLHEYRLWRSTVSGRDFRLVNMNVAASTYTDTEVVNGVDYYYRVEAVDTSGNVSLASDEALGLMPVYVPVFSADFQLCEPTESTTVSNLNLSTIGGHWRGLPSQAHLRRDKPPEPGFFHVIQQALLVDESSGGFAVKAIFDSQISVDGTEVQLDVKARRYGNPAKNLKIEGRDKNGETSFEIILNMDNRRLGYVHSGSTETMFPEGSNGEIDWNGDTYDPPLNTIRLMLSSTGYSVEYNYGEWLSAEVPYNGSATKIKKIVISATSGQAGIWLDNLRVRRMLPPDDGSNTAPVFAFDPVVATGAVHDEAYTSVLTDDANDVDGDALIFSRVSGPAWLHVRSDGTIYGTPSITDIGTNTFRVKVADPYGANHIVDLEVLVIRGANNPPTFKSDPFTKSAATEDVAYVGTIAGSATDPDTIDTLTFSKTGGPAWLSVAADGTLSGTPANSDVGLNKFTVEVSDGEGGSDTATLKIRVNETSILAGWNQFTSPNENLQNPSETKDPNISGSLAFSNLGADWKRGGPNEGSSDQTYGTIVGAPGNEGTNKDALRCKIEGEYLDFTITNNNPSSQLSLESFNFDAWRRYEGSIKKWSLSVLSGSDITTGALSNGTFVKKNGALPSDSDFDDIDVSLTGLADYTLATGESAMLRLTMTATSGSGNTYLDNFAFSGTLEYLP